MTTMEVILDASDRIAAAQNSSELFEIVTDSADHLGFASIAYLMHQPWAGYDEPCLPHVGGHRPDWYRDYQSNQRWHDDPVVLRINQHVRPFSWLSVDDGTLPRRQRDTLHSIISDYSLTDGIAAPIRGPGEVLGTFSAAFATRPEPKRLPELQIACAWLGAAVQERIVEISSDADGDEQPLTPTQKQIVQWMAFGKTSGDVAEIMGSNAVTVRRHLEEARKRLRCSTTPQLVAKALVKRIVTL